MTATFFGSNSLKKRVRIYINGKLYFNGKVEYDRELILQKFVDNKDRERVWVNLIELKI